MENGEREEEEEVTWKKVSMRRILSGWMELVSRSTGSGGPEKL